MNDTLHDFYSQNIADNLLNLVEAEQIAGGHVNSLVKTVNSSGVRAALKASASRQGLKDLGKLASNGYLYYSFGVAPLLADMKSTGLAMRKYTKLVKDYQKGLGQRFSVHRSLKGALSVASGKLRDQYPVNGSIFIDQLTNIAACTKVCTVTGINRAQTRGAFLDKADALSAKLGTPGLFSFLWEKVPYSFVVDWFADLRGVTDYLDNLTVGNERVPDGACITVKTECTVSTKMVHPSSIVPAVGQVIGTSYMKSYLREPVEPRSHVVISTGRFGKRQMALSAALLYQKIAKR